MSIPNKLSIIKLYKNTDHSDIEFVVKNRQGVDVRFPAHRLILALRSPAFESMSFGDMKEKHTVTILDAYAEEFAEFMQLFYLPDVELSTANIAGVVRLIDRYLAEDLYPICEVFMKRTLSNALICDYYELALTFPLSANFTAMLERTIQNKPEMVFKHPAIGSISRLVMSEILKFDKISYKEADLLEGAMAWAEAKCKQKNQPVTADSIIEKLGEMINDIRFPTMSPDVLSDCLRKYPKLLPRDQYADIEKYVATKKELTVAKHFNCEPRFSCMFIFGFTRDFNFPLESEETHFTMRWSAETNAYYLFSFRTYSENGKFPPTVKVDLEINGVSVIYKYFRLTMCNQPTERVVKILEPIKIHGPNVELMCKLIYPSPLPYRCSPQLEDRSVLPNNFQFEGIPGPISEVMFKEIS